jgi:ubiquinol-cytochrome c reductase cytochrome b subunit
MISRIWNWLNERWPISYVIHLSLDEEIQGGSSFIYTLGSAILAVFLLQVTTGIIQLFFYVPQVKYAYNSVSFLRTQVPFGWLINQMHRQGANLMVVLVALHLTRVFVFGAYKHPRELTWLIGVGLLMTVMALTFTGGPLSWDQKGYWEAEVGSNIPGSIPVIGTEISRIMRGGTSMGQLALSRLFAVHVGILPALLAGLIGLHLVAFRRFGTVGPWDVSRRKTTEPFWPDQVFKDTIISIIVILILITLCVFAPKPFYGPADPLDSSFTPKPEWNFLFLYQALKYFHGVLEPVGVVGVPSFFIGFLLLLPFIDRRSERNPAKRPVAMICGAIFAAVITTLTIIGYLSKPGAAPAAPPLKRQVKVAVPENITKGKELFHSVGCISCHRVNGEGGSIGPDLSNEGKRGRSRAWLITQIRNPKAHVPTSLMPPFTSLSDQQVDYIVDYLMGLGGESTQSGSEQKKTAGADSPATAPAAAPLPSTSAQERQYPASREDEQKKQPGEAAYVIGNADHGKDIFEQKCVSCHGPQGTDKVPNPGSDDGFVPALNPIDKELFSKEPQTFAKNIDVFIQHGSVPSGPNPQFHMLAFGDDHTLTQQQIANVEAYILHLNSINRAQLENPGLPPKRFFIIIVPAVILFMLILAGIYKCLP